MGEVVILMTADQDRALNDLIELAKQQALLDDFALDDGSVRLRVGTFQIELDRKGAADLLRSLLAACEKAKKFGEE